MQGGKERLTQLDRDPSDSWFDYHQVGLKGHTGAPPLSRLSSPHSELSASERLEQRSKQRGSFKHSQTWDHTTAKVLDYVLDI